MLFLTPRPFNKEIICLFKYPVEYPLALIIPNSLFSLSYFFIEGRIHIISLSAKFGSTATTPLIPKSLI